METLEQDTSRTGPSNEQAALEQLEVRVLNLPNNFPTSVASTEHRCSVDLTPKLSLEPVEATYANE